MAFVIWVAVIQSVVDAAEHRLVVNDLDSLPRADRPYQNGLDRVDDIQLHVVGSRGEQWWWNHSVDFRFAWQSFQDLNHAHIILSVLVAAHSIVPVDQLGVVGAQLDSNDVRLTVLGHLPLDLVPVASVRAIILEAVLEHGFA